MSTTPASPGEFGRRDLPPEQPSRPIVPKSASEALRPEAGTPPPRRSRASRGQVVVFLNFMISLIMIVVIGAEVELQVGVRRDHDLTFRAVLRAEQTDRLAVRSRGLVLVTKDRIGRDDVACTRRLRCENL